MAEQQQRGGVGSTNIQIASVTTGLTYSDVRDIASDLFQQNFANLMAAARETANLRAEEIREEIIAKLEKDARANPSSFSQVEKQVSLLEAQKAYAISGDEDLKELLVNAVIGISEAPERSKKSIILSEAIKIAPLLTLNQLRALGISFAIWHVNFGATSLRELFGKYTTAIKLDDPHIELSDGDLRHLEYLGCGTSGIGKLSFHSLMSGDFPGLICAGFTEEELKAAFAPESVPLNLFRRSSRDPGKFETIFQNERRIAEFVGITSTQRSKLSVLIKERLIDEQRLKSELEPFPGNAGYLYERWTSSKLSGFKLTSAGIAVGYTFISERVPLPDIDIWL